MNTKQNVMLRWLRRLGIRRTHAVLPILALAFGLGLIHNVGKSAATASMSTPAQPSEFQLARMSDEITVHAAGRGNPWINLSDGHELITPYSGPRELTSLLERNEARPLSLCSADFDEDGVPDLISGYGGPNGGIITLLRGNVDSIYPNALEAQERRKQGTFTDAPFLSPAYVFGVPEANDFIGAGDFDGDGHWDVVTAARGSSKLYLMSGDGKAGLHQTKTIHLPGGVTAMVIGEINRRDGLDDIVVGVSDKQGARVLVFEGAEGALRASPELFEVPAEVASMALGQLDDSYESDLAVAAGHELICIYGRDRRSSLSSQQRNDAPKARIEHRWFDFNLESIALEDNSRYGAIAIFGNSGKMGVLRRPKSETGQSPQSWREIADWRWMLIRRGSWSTSSKLLGLNLKGSGTAEVAVLDPRGKRLWLINDSVVDSNVSAGSAVAQPMGLSAVVDFDDEPQAALRMRLNSDAIADIAFLLKGRVSPASVHSSAAMTFTVVNTNDSGPGSLRQAISDSNNNPGADTIRFSIGSGIQTIKPLSLLPVISDTTTVDGTTQPGFQGKPLVQISGANAGPGSGIQMLRGGNSVIRGLAISEFSNAVFVNSSSNNIVEGNFLGTDSSGMIAKGNGGGVSIDDFARVGVVNNLIGGTAAPARNVISANSTAIGIFNPSFDPLVSDNRVQGNLIGTDITGTLALANKDFSIRILGAFNTVIGGATTGARNVISGNNALLFPAPPGFITSLAAIRLEDARGSVVQGNFLGTDLTGQRPLGNNTNGIIVLGSENCLIGGTTVNGSNVISGNLEFGIILSDSFGHVNLNTLVQGNMIGTDATGNVKVGNNRGGIAISSNFGNTIGGEVSGARNVISGNAEQGILIGVGGNGATAQNTIQGNFIGTGLTSNTDIGNGLDGILVNADSISNPVNNNRIAFNKGCGIRIPNAPGGNPGLRIAITSNQIYSNKGLGVDLGPDGTTANDDLDIDLGANDLQNFPSLASPSTLNRVDSVIGPYATVSIPVSLKSTPNSVFTLEFFFGGNCDGSGHQFSGQIPISLGTRQVTTNSAGIASLVFTFDFPSILSSGFVNSLATDASGNTSEVSECVAVSNPNPLRIANACRGEGKQLIVNGAGFSEGARVFLNGEQEKTLFVSATQVIAKKAGKRAQTGDSLKVRNPNGSETPALNYTRVTCSP